MVYVEFKVFVITESLLILELSLSITKCLRLLGVSVVQMSESAKTLQINNTEKIKKLRAKINIVLSIYIQQQFHDCQGNSKYGIKKWQW